MKGQTHKIATINHDPGTQETALHQAPSVTQTLATGNGKTSHQKR